MIQCVGSRDDKRPYCSRICCEHAVKNALTLHELNPSAQTTVVYRDIRTYGFYEKYYYAARDNGTIFVRYEPTDKPKVLFANGDLKVSFMDGAADRIVDVAADLVVLTDDGLPGDVMLGGVWHVLNGEAQVRGTFEEESKA